MKLIDLKDIKFPTKKDEDFRKINLNPILEKEFESFNEYKLNIEVQEGSELISSANELIKINERLETELWTKYKWRYKWANCDYTQTRRWK